ncbi:fumarylacetoacetate hydrolase family protein [Streptomyces sp. NPDC058067]|uniref:fumarylacetoacetate hydrolase family protein n=1 Tax=Streptomyces sp. NPDC058067 TaxID=3346324 RepID=UPI0036E1DCEA
MTTDPADSTPPFDPDDCPPDSLLRAADGQGATRWYVRTERGLAALDATWSLGSLLALKAAELHEVIDAAPDADPGRLTLLAPLDDDTEVWACGVTYEVSRAARMEESAEAADVYARVYDAERPELFYKATGRRVSGPGGPVGVRGDSAWNVPEPELALVCAADATVAGYTICNDMSSRSIEGENPLYLPQAKMYRHSCAVGPWIRLARSVPEPRALGITATIARGGEPLWSGATSTARLRRDYEELVSYLYRAQTYPRGAVLATGTCAVPDESVSVAEGDVVEIEIEGVGRLSNPAVSV